MKKVAFIVGFGLLTLNLFAGGFALGVSGGLTAISDRNNVNSQTASQTSLNMNVTGLVGLEDGWEVGGLLGLASLSYTDPSGNYNNEDGYTFTSYTVGALVNKAIFTMDQLSVMLGGDALFTFGSSNKAFNPSSGGSSYNLSSMSIGAAFPVTIEYKLSPKLALRLSNPLATFTLSSTQYEYSSSTTTVTQDSITLLPTSLALGVYYYF
jgi:hypothetical protein